MKKTPQFTVKLYVPPPDTLDPEWAREELARLFPDPPADSLLIRAPQKWATVKLDEGLRFGSDEDNDVVIESDYISAKHCELRKTAEGWLLRDLKSANGTWVNGKRVKRRAITADDVIQIGHVCMMVAR